MENFLLIGTILTIHIFSWLTPGPLFVLILRNSLVYSRKTGIWTALGIAIGNLIHITYVIAGISFLISTSPIIFTIIKFLGVGYLTYIGFKTLFIKIESQKADNLIEQKDITPLQAAKIGFLTNILSPKASLFFASIFATIISSGSPSWVVILLGIAMPLNSFIMASILSFIFTHRKVKFVYTKHQDIINKCLGITLILLAVIIAFHK